MPQPQKKGSESIFMDKKTPGSVRNRESVQITGSDQPLFLFGSSLSRDGRIRSGSSAGSLRTARLDCLRTSEGNARLDCLRTARLRGTSLRTCLRTCEGSARLRGTSVRTCLRAARLDCLRSARLDCLRTAPLRSTSLRSHSKSEPLTSALCACAEALTSALCACAEALSLTSLTSALWCESEPLSALCACAKALSLSSLTSALRHHTESLPGRAAPGHHTESETALQSGLKRSGLLSAERRLGVRDSCRTDPGEEDPGDCESKNPVHSSLLV